MKWRGDTPLSEVQRVIDEHMEPGMPEMWCPACTRRVKADGRKIDSTMATELCKLYRWDDDNPGKWMDCRQRHGSVRAKGSTHSLLRHWGLVERRDVRTGENAGWWRITAKGRDFIDEKIRVPWKAYTFRAECRGFSKKATTSIREALGDHFDLDELLGRVPRRARS